jgi:hypothetical protein
MYETSSLSAQVRKEAPMSAQAQILVPSDTRDIEDRIAHFTAKQAHETDAWDLREIKQDVVIVDAGSLSAFAGLYVTGSDGIGCNASTKGALNLARPGFRVKEPIGGLDWWKRDGYDTVTNTHVLG